MTLSVNHLLLDMHYINLIIDALQKKTSDTLNMCSFLNYTLIVLKIVCEISFPY